MASEPKLLQTKPAEFNTKSSDDAQWKASKKVSAPAKPPVGPKASGKKMSK
jgi:hypothetical protein